MKEIDKRLAYSIPVILVATPILVSVMLFHRYGFNGLTTLLVLGLGISYVVPLHAIRYAHKQRILRLNKKINGVDSGQRSKAKKAEE